MKITHVVRAEEHLTNTFSQVLLFEALGHELPTFAHVPYVAEPGSKKKLSKRFGAVGLDHYMEKGYLPDAMMNYLARLGWSYDGGQEIFTRSELIEKFTLDRVTSAPRESRSGQALLDPGRVDEDRPVRREGRGGHPLSASRGVGG